MVFYAPRVISTFGRTGQKNMEDTIQKANILIVDDKPAKLQALESVLSGLDENILTARSGKEALKHVLKTDFAVILLDVNMPEMDGFETAELIRKRKSSANTPIIFVTAIGTSESERARGYSIGAVDYIFQPVPPEIIKYKVERFVELHKMTQKLEMHADALVKLNSMLEASNKELEAFSYSVSHDLSAPLRAMEGFSRILIERYKDALDDKGQDYLNRVIDSANNMSQLIDDLLKLSRVSLAEMSLDKVDLTAMAHQIVAALKETDPARIVEVVIAEGLIAKGDVSLLQVALQNLLNNAWKFSNKRPQARIEFGECKNQGQDCFFVKDNGAGFNMDQAHKLFSPFQRFHSASDFPGTGIGLGIVQRAINRHGGKVWAEAEEDKGATFYFSLPRSKNS